MSHPLLCAKCESDILNLMIGKFKNIYNSIGHEVICPYCGTELIIRHDEMFSGNGKCDEIFWTMDKKYL